MGPLCGHCSVCGRSSNGAGGQQDCRRCVGPLWTRSGAGPLWARARGRKQPGIQPLRNSPGREFQRVRCDTEALQTKGGREQSPGTMGNSEVPDAFCCPIGLDIMSDPVFLIETGHTFERRLIEAHLQRSDRGPLCGVQLKSKTLMPNYALRQAIEAYLSDRSQAPGRFAPPPPTAPSPPTAGAIAGQ